MSETKTTAENIEMLCFVLTLSACEQCLSEIQQNIELDMPLFPPPTQEQKDMEKVSGQADF